LVPWLDVEGRHSADIEIIKGHIFPKVKSMSLKKISNLIEILNDAKLIILYSANGENYLQFTKFHELQSIRRDRESDSKIPAPSKDSVITPGVIQDNPPLIEVNVREVNVIEDKDLTTTERKILNELKKVKNYPYNFIDTIEYIRELAVDFPGIDMLDEIQKKLAWWRDNPLTKKSNPHLQLRNWFKNAVKFNAERRQGDEVGGQGTKDKAMALYEKQKAMGVFDDLDEEDY
jgi:hypothetical protein